jgi:flavin-dependent dehydrogenase
MFAEGIRHALETGRMCAVSIKSAYDQNIYDLSEYNNQVTKYVGNKWKISRLFADLFYHCPFDLGRDIVANQISSLSFQNILEIGFDYKYGLLLYTLL